MTDRQQRALAALDALAADVRENLRAGVDNSQSWIIRQQATVLRERLSELLGPHSDTVRQARPVMPDGREPVPLGDAVYAAWVGSVLKLSTSNGVAVTNVIWLEPDTYTALIRFVERSSVREDRPDEATNA